MKAMYQKPETTTTMMVMKQMILTASEPTAGIDSSKEVQASSVESRSARGLWDDED